MRYLSRGWRCVAEYPLLLLLPIAMTLVVAVLGIGVAGAALGWAAAGQASRGGGAILLGIAAFALLAPAMSSGYNSLVLAAVRGEGPGMEVFWGNVRRYYGRIMGGALLLALLVALLGLLFGRWSGRLLGISLVSLSTMVISFLTHLWFAAILIEDRGITDGIRGAAAELFTRFVDYGPLLGIAVAAGILVPAILQAGEAGQVVGVRSLLSSAITSAISTVVRAGAFAAYDDVRAIPVLDAPPGAPPLF